jgi:hypothetical protein
MNIKEALCYESFLFYAAVIFLPFFLAMLTMVVKGIVSFVFFIRMMLQECFLSFAGNM